VIEILEVVDGHEVGWDNVGKAAILDDILWQATGDGANRVRLCSLRTKGEAQLDYDLRAAFEMLEWADELTHVGERTHADQSKALREFARRGGFEDVEPVSLTIVRQPAAHDTPPAPPGPGSTLEAGE
jgi:hypothetical protein